MSSDLSSFLAKRYLVADPKPSKKRKRKQAAEGLIIADDDDSWAKRPSSTQDDGPALDGSVTISGTSADFRRTKKSNWKTLNAPSNAAVTTSSASSSSSATKPSATESDAAAADAILASAAAESAAAREADDELPAIADTNADADDSVVKMSDGTHAGLQSAASVAAQLRKRREAEEAEFAALRKKKGGGGKKAEEEETVYRDATGRRVDVAMKRAEARRLAAEQEERDRERQAKTTSRGDVQAADAAARRAALEEAKTMSFARTADDEEMNRELKERQRWNDPMAQFMDSTGGSGAGGKGKKGKGRKPQYTGAAPPNRYGIRPGYRWDGVDRSNGFEAERFKAINRRERNKGLDYAWQMDE